MQEMQIMKNEPGSQEMQAKLITYERRAIKAESQIESLQMELQMLKLDSKALKMESNG